MSNFKQSNLENIRKIFCQKTKTQLPAKKISKKRIKVIAAAAVLICCFSLSAYAVSLFSALEGDELAWNAVYKGEGVVEVTVENFAEKDLHLQPQIKLMRWNSGEEVPKISEKNVFNGATVPAGDKVRLEIDLSLSYDVESLEEPLTDDWYYFVFTNNHFAFGQDWMCSISFSIEQDAEELNSEAAVMGAETEILSGINEKLRWYFCEDSLNGDKLRESEEEYVREYEELLAGFDGQIIKAVEPSFSISDPEEGVIFDENTAENEQYLLTGLHWQGREAKLRLIATEDEKALCLSVSVPSQKYEDAGSFLPLFYILTYDWQECQGEDKFTYIYGQIYSFDDLAEYKIFEDDKYTCFEVSPLIYKDLAQYVNAFRQSHTDLCFDEQSMKRIENFYAYYQANLGRLIVYR